MKAMKARYVLDFVLTALIIFELLYQYTGNLLHEVVGAIFGITVISHVVLSHKWISTTARKVSDHKPLKAMHTTRLVLALILGVLFVALAASSIAISHQLSALTGLFLMGTAYDMWVLIHLVSSYSFAAVTVIHLVIHWTGAFAAFKVPYNPDRRRAINASFGTLAALGVLAVGATALTPLKQAASMAAENALGETNTSSSARDAQNTTPNTQSQQVPNDTPQAPDSTYQNAPSKGGKGRNFKKDSGDTPSQLNSPNETSTNPGGSNNSAVPSTGNTPPSSSSENTGSSSTSDQATQICTLCRERCPLSAPKCNRPYLAGLIS